MLTGLLLIPFGVISYVLDIDERKSLLIFALVWTIGTMAEYLFMNWGKEEK